MPNQLTLKLLKNPSLLTSIPGFFPEFNHSNPPIAGSVDIFCFFFDSHAHLMNQVKTFFWDSNAQFTTMLNNPTAYGFADATSYGSAATDFWG